MKELWLTVPEAAKVIEKKPRTVYEWISLHLLPVRKVSVEGRKVTQVPLSHLRRVEAERSGPGRPSGVPTRR